MIITKQESKFRKVTWIELPFTSIAIEVSSSLDFASGTWEDARISAPSTNFGNPANAIAFANALIRAAYMAEDMNASREPIA